ncbi:MAG: TonB-dependent receptor SusC [Owenweeksia sp. TMED14]|nr:MAG: TonB-dependent receptor SusC [Owenweeksia sp. TMED14]|tara:strand:+ start:7494 stop:10352 length:2859 start_codon:yes stop_codon:yes gene_type:complete
MILPGRVALLIVIFFSATSAWAQSLGTLKGLVTDSKTGEPLPNVGITLIGTYIASVSDYDGNYIISKIPVGDFSVKVQFIGYGTQIINGVRLKKGEIKLLDIKISSSVDVLQTVTVIGQKSQVDLESAKSQRSINRDDISQMGVRDVQEVISLQAGIAKTNDGIQIRGARVYETEYLVDGISAQDPLAGTGFGVQVQSSAIQSIQVTTGGASAEFGGGSSGVISTKIREGGEHLEVSGRLNRDYLSIRPNSGSRSSSSFNTDQAEINISFPIPYTEKKITVFNAATMNLTDDYFPNVADQLYSSLFKKNTGKWSPRQRNSWTHTAKIRWQIHSGTKLTVTNQHSLNINQNSRTLQIVGFDAILAPGYQYRRSLNLDNATTYTHHSNLTALNFTHIFNPHWGLTASAGRMFTNLRADANGRPFRSETLDALLDEDNIASYPLGIFNPYDPSGIYYIQPGNGLVNNGGISSTWHDHYAEEYTIRAKMNYYPDDGIQQIVFGWEHQINAYQWIDVVRPWVGAPIIVNDSLTTPSISIGSSNDIWRVQPQKGGAFFEDKINYKGIQASLGLRLNYWAPGKFADQAISNIDAPVIDEIRNNYLEKTLIIGGLRWKARLLPRINVSFPVTPNNVLYFNYGHSMRLPHPRFVYAGLDPVYQDRSFLSFLGNPDLDPEVNVSYEVGYKSAITRDIAFTASAFNNNRFDYIVSRRVIVNDQTGRPVSKTMYINQDYAKIQGIELGLDYRLGKHLRLFGNLSLQVARGKSNSARESSLQIEQNGEVSLTRENFLAWDRPWNTNLGIFFSPDSSLKINNSSLKGLNAYLQFNGSSGYRYTPYEYIGTNDLGRPQYRPLIEQYLSKLAAPWFNWDSKWSYTLLVGKRNKGVTLSLEIKNIFNRLNSQIINPITGKAYVFGDDVPNEWRDPRPEYNGPQESGLDPRNPARYQSPRQILYGLTFKI